MAAETSGFATVSNTSTTASKMQANAVAALLREKTEAPVHGAIEDAGLISSNAVASLGSVADGRTFNASRIDIAGQLEVIASNAGDPVTAEHARMVKAAVDLVNGAISAVSELIDGARKDGVADGAVEGALACIRAATSACRQGAEQLDRSDSEGKGGTRDMTSRQCLSTFIKQLADRCLDCQRFACLVQLEVDHSRFSERGKERAGSTRAAAAPHELPDEDELDYDALLGHGDGHNDDCEAERACRDADGDAARRDDAAESDGEPEEQDAMATTDECIIQAPARQSKQAHQCAAVGGVVYVMHREWGVPISDIKNPMYLAGNFPTLFPWGYGVSEQMTGEAHPSFEQHVRYLLRHSDLRFRKHPTFK